MNLYDFTVPQLKRMLTNLDGWIVLAVEFAQKKKIEPAVLLASRLAPDQHPLTRQIQSACDNAKFAAARLTGKEPPKHPDTETTIEELRARIQNVIAYLDSFQPSDFQGVEEKLLVLPVFGGKGMKGADYLSEFLLPNFYFHCTTAYSILRHNGVELGKKNYIGNITLRDA